MSNLYHVLGLAWIALELFGHNSDSDLEELTPLLTLPCDEIVHHLWLDEG